MGQRTHGVGPWSKAVGLAGLVVSVVLGSSDAGAETIWDALSSAYSSNPTLKAAEALLRSVNENLPQELANYRPAIDFTTSVTGGRSERTGGVNPRFENEARLSAAITITQPLFRGSQTLAGTRRAKAEVKAERARLRQTEQVVLLGAATAFLDVWRDTAIVDLNLKNESVLREQLQATQRRLDVGEVTRTDLSQARSRLADATGGRVDAEGDLGASRANYKEFVGSFPASLDDPPPVLGLPGTLEEAVAIAVVDNPLVVAAQYDERAERQNVRVQFGALLPEVNLVGTLTHLDSTNSAIKNQDEAFAAAELRVPLYEQGLISSLIRQSKQVANQRRLVVDEAIRNAEQETVAAWENLQSSNARKDAFEVSVEANRLALEGVRAENLAGVRTVLDVLDAETEFLNAQTNLAIAERDLQVASYELLVALGRMEAGFLGLQVDLYNPVPDYDDVRGQIYGFGQIPYLSDW